MESSWLLKAVCVVFFINDELSESSTHHHFPSGVSGCDRGVYENVIDDFCLVKFKSDMGAIDKRLWCSWPDTTQIYEDLTNCTYQVALSMDCFWPDQIVDRFFARIHRDYFLDCPPTGRLIRDPPASVLAPFIGVPILVTLLVTALVVWRSKHTEGVL
ncbi:receptor activity-modifying protein 1-like isoform X1 [Syngnathus acus]|uniref:receptor activity-modifying protein 1-like isoform X1 n=1 Tax=Syngnathus acus TaxID=161584 RepID=UPI001885DF15|nr:receptor activity-modifying protein 1-like isoform X1 [Syngnathus acus]XP_037097330.1 receptor activity-modifying protein 1-like isoform X1 [Syngnathus acus]